MTTYILHGGATSENTPGNAEFFRQFTESVTHKHVNILMCYWASTKDTWEEKYKEDKKSISLYSRKHFNLQVATDPDDVKEKITTSHVVYVRGGKLQLEPYFNKLTQFKKMLTNKVYLGSSMGAYLVTTNYMVSPRVTDILEVKNGLGLLPFSIVCHWNIKNMKRKQRVRMLKTHAPQLPILTLKESEFVTITY